MAGSTWSRSDPAALDGLGPWVAAEPVERSLVLRPTADAAYTASLGMFTEIDWTISLQHPKAEPLDRRGVVLPRELSWAGVTRKGADLMADSALPVSWVAGWATHLLGVAAGRDLGDAWLVLALSSGLSDYLADGALE